MFEVCWWFNRLSFIERYIWIGIPVSLVSSCFGGCSCVVDGVGFIGLLFVVVVVGRFIGLIC